MSSRTLAGYFYENFSRYAEDLYPKRYTKAFCSELAEMAIEIKALAEEKHSMVVAHNYLYPEFHEIADKVGDSLGLSLYAKSAGATRVDFQSVFFMGATAKIITGNTTRVYVPDSPKTLGCSLVFGTDHDWLLKWKDENPGGILVTYINSDAYTKSISDYISTSRNTDKIIVEAQKTYPGKRVLVLPDKYLGYVMRARAAKLGANPDLIDVYMQNKGEFRACCYVHEKIGELTLEKMMDENPDADILIHPECGCSSSCLVKLDAGIIPHGKFYFPSTEEMIKIAKESSSKRFIVATEKGMIYRLRKEVPDKEFLPVSVNAECGYMKSCTLPKLLDSLKSDRREIILCNDCCDPRKPHENESEIHIQKSVAKKAKIGIERMLSIT